MNRIRSAFLLISISFGACSPDLALSPAESDAGRADVAGAARCTGGVTATCGCVGLGMVGVQRCDPTTGVFGECACPAADAPPSPSDAVAEAATDAGAEVRGEDAPIADALLVDTPPGADVVDAGPVDGASSCAFGTTWCGDAYGCRSLETDPNHCGWCGNRVGSLLPDPLHRVLTCRGGAPVRACENGWCAAGWTTATPPDGGVEQGCTVSVATGLPSSAGNVNRFVYHCGACGRQCTAPLGAYSTCTMGTCGWACVWNRADCNRDPADGCEVIIDQNNFNCGGCGRQCAMNERCSGGRCVAI